MKKLIIVTLCLGLLLIPTSLIAQDTNDYEKAKYEIVETFGSFITMFQAYPKYALSTAWENFKNLSDSDSSISAKNRELIQLAVASQIPCEYCVYYHRIIAMANEATEEEIKEAIAFGAQTRQWSMILQGSGISFTEFKAEFDATMKYMEEKAKD